MKSASVSADLALDFCGRQFLPFRTSIIWLETFLKRKTSFRLEFIIAILPSRNFGLLKRLRNLFMDNCTSKIHVNQLSWKCIGKLKLEVIKCKGSYCIFSDNTFRVIINVFGKKWLVLFIEDYYFV